MPNTKLKTSALHKGFSLIELSIVMLILGLLIVSISEGIDLAQSYKLNAARSLTESSPVATTEDLVAWYESTSKKSFDSEIDEDDPDYNSVSDWFDINPQATIKKHGYQTTDDYKPTFSLNTKLKLPMVYFDGTNDCIKLPDNTLPFADHSYTIFIVAHILYNGTNNRTFLSAEANLNQNYNILRYNIVTLNTISTIWDRSYSNQVSIDHNMIITHGYSNGYSATNLNRKMSYYKNGTRLDYLDQSSPSQTAATYNALGCRRNSSNVEGSDFLHGYIGEIIIFNRYLDEEERQAIEHYLSKKWNISIAS